MVFQFIKVFLNMFAKCSLNSVQNHVYTQIRKPNDCSKHREPSKFVCSVFQCVFSIHKMEAIAWRSVSNFVGDAVMRLHFLPIMSKRWLCKRPDWREAQLSSALLSSKRLNWTQLDSTTYLGSTRLDSALQSLAWLSSTQLGLTRLKTAQLA